MEEKEQSSSEEEVSPEEAQLWEKIGEVLKEFHLTSFQTLATRKFIKDKVGNPKDQTVDRVRQWLFMRINGKKLPEKYHPR